MIRLVIVGVAVFLVSLAGTTGALVMKARKAVPAAPADSVAHADSTKAPVDTAATHIAEAQPVDSTGASPAVETPKDAAHADSGSNAVAGAAVPNVPLDGADRQVAYKQLARIFSNMKTTDAAKVLAYMSDEEVEGVLRQLGVRPAAGLLAALPKERAAALSRRLLSTGKESAK